MNIKGTKWNDPVHNFNLKSPFPVGTDNDVCWNWLGALDKGYGVGTLDKKKQPAHVISFKLHGNTIDVGNYVLHKCNNPSCVNPKHLYQGTQQDNINDQFKAGTFVYGENSGNAKLTEADIKYIRNSEKSSRELATELLVSYYTIWDIRKYRSWKHLK